MQYLETVKLTDEQRGALPLFLQKIYTKKAPASTSQAVSLLKNEKFSSSTLQNYRAQKPISKILPLVLK